MWYSQEQEVKSLIADGWLVVVEAYIGSRYRILGKFKNRDEAEQCVENIVQRDTFDEDRTVYIEPRKTWGEAVNENLL